MRCGRLIEIIDWKFSGEAFGRIFSFRGAYAPLIFFCIFHWPKRAPLKKKKRPSEEKKAPLWRKKSAPLKSVSAHKFTSAPQKRYRDTVWPGTSRLLLLFHKKHIGSVPMGPFWAHLKGLRAISIGRAGSNKLALIFWRIALFFVLSVVVQARCRLLVDFFQQVFMDC